MEKILTGRKMELWQYGIGTVGRWEEHEEKELQVK